MGDRGWPPTLWRYRLVCREHQAHLTGVALRERSMPACCTRGNVLLHRDQGRQSRSAAGMGRSIRRRDLAGYELSALSPRRFPRRAVLLPGHLGSAVIVYVIRS